MLEQQGCEQPPASHGIFDCRVLRSCLVPQCSYPPFYPTSNDVLRIVTGCLRPTPADNLPILAGIQAAELRRSGATLPLRCRAMEPEHLLHSAFTRPSASNPHPPPSLAPHLHHFYFTSSQPIRPKEASDSDFTIEDVMLWPGMRFSLRSQCKRCSAGRLHQLTL